MCSDCEAYGLKKHGLTRSDCIYFLIDNQDFLSRNTAAQRDKVSLTVQIYLKKI